MLSQSLTAVRDSAEWDWPLSGTALSERAAVRDSSEWHWPLSGTALRDTGRCPGQLWVIWVTLFLVNDRHLSHLLTYCKRMKFYRHTLLTKGNSFLWKNFRVHWGQKTYTALSRTEVSDIKKLLHLWNRKNLQNPFCPWIRRFYGIKILKNQSSKISWYCTFKGPPVLCV